MLVPVIFEVPTPMTDPTPAVAPTPRSAADTGSSRADDVRSALSALPSVDRLVRSPECAELVALHGAVFVTDEARGLLGELRERLLSGDRPPFATDLPELVRALGERCARRLAPRMRRVLNLTGTVLHTNLGRAVLPQVAIDHLVAMMAGPNNLEYDLERGGRGDRDDLVEALLCEITGAEAATVVNNNAAAVLLTLAALARDREVVVSRGELVEIGGAFRMPDVMASAGARMVEVGTTNRTHLADYERAIGPATAMLMKVHTSNYAIQGFTSAVSEAELAPLARARGLLLATDLGSGSLIDMTRHPPPRSPVMAACPPTDLPVPRMPSQPRRQLPPTWPGLPAAATPPPQAPAPPLTPACERYI